MNIGLCTKGSMDIWIVIIRNYCRSRYLFGGLRNKNASVWIIVSIDTVHTLFWEVNLLHY